MATTRKQYTAKLKARVAIEAIRGEKTLNQLGSQFGLHPVQIAHWRRTALDHIEDLFVDGRTRHSQEAEADADRDALFEEIGRLKVELDFVKKKLACSSEDRRVLVEPGYAEISIRRQCELLGVSRASWYYEPAGESQENLRLMRLIDEQYTRAPFYGSRRMTAWLRDRGHDVNRKRVTRLMQVMGIEAVYPKPNLSRGAAGHTIYPYLLQGV